MHLWNIFVPCEMIFTLCMYFQLCSSCMALYWLTWKPLPCTASLEWNRSFTWLPLETMGWGSCLPHSLPSLSHCTGAWGSVCWAWDTWEGGHKTNFPFRVCSTQIQVIALTQPTMSSQNSTRQQAPWQTKTVCFKGDNSPPHSHSGSWCLSLCQTVWWRWGQHGTQLECLSTTHTRCLPHSQMGSF